MLYWKKFSEDGRKWENASEGNFICKSSRSLLLQMKSCPLYQHLKPERWPEVSGKDGKHRALGGKPKKIRRLSHDLPYFLLQRLLYRQTYNFRSQNVSAVSNIPNNRTVNSPTVPDTLFSQSIRIFVSLIDRTVVNNECLEFLYLFQIKL